MCGDNSAADKARELTVQTALRIAESAQKAYDTRRSYEWKINFGLWTAYGVVAGFGWDKSLPVGVVISGVAVLCAVFVVYWLVWTRGIQTANKRDMECAVSYWAWAEKALPGDLTKGWGEPGYAWRRANPELEPRRRPSYSRGSQVVITLAFLAIATVALIYAPGPV